MYSFEICYGSEIVLVFFSIDLSKNITCLLIKLYLISIICSWFNSFIHFIQALLYAVIGNSDIVIFQCLIFFAQLFYICSHVLFLTILILCAKGYLVVRIQMRKKIMVEIILIILCYTLVQIVILIIKTVVSE